MKTNLLVCFLSIALFVSAQKDREVIKQIDSLNSSALNFFNSNKIVESFTQFNKAKALSESLEDDYGKAFASFNLGNIYNLMHDFDSAENCFNTTLVASKKINDNCLLASSYLSLGKLYKDKRLLKKSINYFEQALRHSSSKNQQDCDKQELQEVLFDARICLNEVFVEANKLDEALVSLIKVEEALSENKINSNLEAYHNYIYGLYYSKKELYNKAKIEFNKSIELLGVNTSNYKLLSNTYKQISIIYSKQKNTDEAYAYLLKHNSFRDKFINEQKIKQETIVNSKFLIEDYKNNAQLANNERIHQLEITNSVKRVNAVISVTLVLLFILMIALYRNYNSKKKLSNKLKSQNKDLEKAKNEALKSSELKSKFISNVSHELRTPLYGVVGLTSLLLNNNNLSKRDMKFLKSLKYSGDYLLNLVNDILQVGKMESEKIELKNVSVNLKNMLNSIVNSFDYKLQETNNEIEIVIDDYVPDYIICDQVRLSQVLINLIGNSVKFTESGKIYLRVKLLSRNADESARLCFEVEDNGMGIPKEKFKTIFDTFTQVGEESNINYQGTGLGLSITKNIVELFDSKINLESELGKGTTFSFEVDFKIDNKVITDKSISVPFDENKNGLNKKHRILVAEDNKINQIVTKNLLLKENYSCTIVSNGKEALEEIKRDNYDLVLMDINMPIMNGNEATAAIKKFNSRIPVVALTAADIEEVKQDYKKIGYCDIITKPFDNYDFFQVIASNIQKAEIKEVELVIAS